MDNKDEIIDSFNFDSDETKIKSAPDAFEETTKLPSLKQKVQLGEGEMTKKQALNKKIDNLDNILDRIMQKQKESQDKAQKEKKIEKPNIENKQVEALAVVDEEKGEETSKEPGKADNDSFVEKNFAHEDDNHFSESFQPEDKSIAEESVAPEEKAGVEETSGFNQEGSTTEIGVATEETTLESVEKNVTEESYALEQEKTKQEAVGDDGTPFSGDILSEEKIDGTDARAADVAKKVKEKRDKSYKNSYIYGFIFIVFSILLEVTNFIRLGLGFLPTNFAIELCIILIIAGIIFIVPTEPAKISLLSIFFGIQLVMNVANASLYKMMYEMVTVDMIFTLGFETANAFEFNQIDLTSLIVAIVILVLFILTIIFANMFMPRFKIKKDKVAIVSLITLLLSVELLGIGGLKICKDLYFSNETEFIQEDNEYLYGALTAKYASLKKYGFWSFYINNANVFFNYQKTISDKEYSNLSKYVNEGKNYTYTGSSHMGTDVSGSLEGDNLIVIMMESIEWFAIDPVNTPNLYSFINNNSVKFENFVAKNKTNISEDIPILGSIVNNSSFSSINGKVGIKTPNSLPNLFKKEGYESVNYFHDYYGDFYDRNELNKKFGFSDVYSIEDCSKLKTGGFGDFVDDGDFISELRTKFMPANEKFFSFYTTVSTHGPYENSSKRYTEHYNLFEQNYDDYCSWVNDNKSELLKMGFVNLTPKKDSRDYKILKEYKSKAIALENMFNVIDLYLKSTNDEVRGGKLIDNTTIVMYADHNAYYSDLSFNVKNLSKYDKDIDLYRLPFVIYNKSLAPKKVDTFCNTYDIYPTICDLYGISFNRNLVQGYSVFSADDKNGIQNSVFASTICGVFDNNYYTVTFDDYTVQKDDIETGSQLKAFKQKINDFFVRQDYIEKYYQINFESYRAKK